MHVRRQLLPVVAISMLALGCDDDDDPGRDGGGEVALDAERPLGDGSVASLTEAEVAGLMNAINAGEIALARSVEDRLSDDDVEDLASDVISGHTDSAAAHEDLIADLGITPVESASSEAVDRLASEMVEQLSAVSGSALDAEYVDAQIIIDAELLWDVQEVMVPSATTARYREFLFAQRDVLVSTLRTARELDEPGSSVVTPDP